MFCIKCGKPASVNNFCDSCYLSDNKLFEIENFTVAVCGACGSYYDKGWKKDRIEDIILTHVKTKNKISGKKVKINRIGNKLIVYVGLRGFIRPSIKIKAETTRIEIILKKQKCDNCVKISGNYYEALVQIRGGNKDGILKKVKQEGLLSVEHADNGYNVKFIRKQDAKRLATVLKKEYHVKGTFKLVGEKKGKRLYRSFYSIS